MRYATSDGKVISVPDMCAHCSLSTGGQHESHCPFYQPPWEPKMIDMKVNITFFTKQRGGE